MPRFKQSPRHQHLSEEWSELAKKNNFEKHSSVIQK